MGFVKKTWQDRASEFPGRRKMTDVVSGAVMNVDVTRNEGEVAQAGDAFSAENMNSLEQRIDDAFISYTTPINVTIPAIGWTSSFPYTNTVTVDGIAAGSNVKILGVYSPSNASLENVKAWNKAAGMLMTNSDSNATQEGKIVFKAYKKPSVDFTVIIEGGQ